MDVTNDGSNEVVDLEDHDDKVEIDLSGLKWECVRCKVKLDGMMFVLLQNSGLRSLCCMDCYHWALKEQRKETRRELDE